MISAMVMNDEFELVYVGDERWWQKWEKQKLNVEGGVYNTIGGGANRKFKHAA
jgi:hypothetical protein